MADIDSIDSDILRRTQQAAARWQARAEVRDNRSEALRDGKPTKADTPSRLAARVNNLVDDVRRVSDPEHLPSNPVLRELVVRPAPVVAEELTDRIVNEALIATADFLSVEFLERGAMAARSVGRILIEDGGRRQPIGTGFLVGPGLMLTNQHVLPSARRAAQCILQMDYELRLFGAPRAPQDFALLPDRVFLANYDLDFALVAVAEVSAQGNPLADYGWLPLNEAQGKISISDKDYINIIQHPGGEEKQVVLRNNRVLDMRTGNDPQDDVMGSFLHYEADTAKGSSGSPVLSDSWQVVALHHSGVPRMDEQRRWLRRDGAIWRDGDNPDDIDWIANEAVRVSGIVGAIRLAKLDPPARAIVDAALAARPGMGWSPPAPPARPTITETPSPTLTEALPISPQPAQMVSTVSPGTSSGTGAAISLDIPLRVTIEIAPPDSSTTPVIPPTRPDVTFLERITPAAMADRKGYDPDFLGFSLPLPGIKPKPGFGGLLAVTQPSHPKDSHELRYQNYSVLMCAGRRMAYLSACNVDFMAPATVTREEDGDPWRFDPRIPSAAQLGAGYYRDNDYDKGHLSRRDDLARGPTREAAIAGNKDSFFWTNCAPQHYLLNRSNAYSGANLLLWGDLENYISNQGARLGRLAVFNGPVFGPADKPLRDALVPLSFYKIVAWSGADGPGAIGFVLDQAELIEALPERRLDPGIFSIRQRRIEAIGADLDLDLRDLAALDRMPAPQASRKATKGTRDSIEIASVADILM